MNETIEIPGAPSDITRASLRQLGRIISAHWPEPYFGAVPYIAAMQNSDDDGRYYEDDASCLTMYFLSNAASWRGAIARTIKKELRRRLKETEG